MNGHNLRRGRERYAAWAAGCAVHHDWCPEPDPVTLRVHCRRCTAFKPGRPDVLMANLAAGFLADALGWDLERGWPRAEGDER